MAEKKCILGSPPHTEHRKPKSPIIPATELQGFSASGPPALAMATWGSIAGTLIVK